jgi:hypothetical protein
MEIAGTPFLLSDKLAEQEENAEHDNGSASDQYVFSELHPARRGRSTYCSTIARTAICLFALWGIISLGIQLSHIPKTASAISRVLAPLAGDVFRPQTLPSNLNDCDCGSSIAEAISRGCIYDSLATAWLPPFCRDDELTAQFDQAGPGINGSWPYFADPGGQIPINKEKIAALGETEATFWSSREWHIAHCVFYWQKYLRMRHTNAVMESRFDNIDHVKHCGRLIMKKPPKQHFLIEVPVVLNSRPKLVVHESHGNH